MAQDGPPGANLYFSRHLHRESPAWVAFKGQMTNAVNRARSAQEWGAVLPQWLGMAGLVFCALVWLTTSRIEPLLLTAFGGLIFVGQAGEAVVTLKRSPPDQRPPVESSPVPENGQA